RLAGDAPLQTGWNLVASPVESPQPVTEALNSIAGQYESVWGYDSGQWQDYIAGQPEFLNNLNEIHPARACWLQMGSPAQLQFTPQPLKIYYYHPDHLGSSSLVTDSSGNVVERTQYYPYGRPRYEEHTGFDSAYKYTGKELDKATGLMYYEARYYDSVVSNFISVDPLAIFGGQDKLSELTAYAYAGLNPVKFTDPSGNKKVLTALANGKLVQTSPIRAPWTMKQLRAWQNDEIGKSNSVEEIKLIELKYHRAKQVVQNWHNRYGRWDKPALAHELWAIMFFKGAYYDQVRFAGGYYPKNLLRRFFAKRADRGRPINNPAPIFAGGLPNPGGAKMQFNMYTHELRSRDPGSIEFNPAYRKYIKSSIKHVEPPLEAIKMELGLKAISSNKVLRRKIKSLRKVLVRRGVKINDEF
ncbi:MAG: hypothetical protein J7K09_04015, partial [Desulfuromusa sp.]|nr:hypothetical protein [Desulfuromusa sp.]